MRIYFNNDKRDYIEFDVKGNTYCGEVAHKYRRRASMSTEKEFIHFINRENIHYFLDN